MNREEIDYWLKLFSNNNQSFMSKDGKKITLFNVFQELKELHFLLKIKNDYIKELEGYKHNLDRDYLRLEEENEELKERINKVFEVIDEILIFNDVNGTTMAIGNAKEELQFYLSDCKTLDEFRKILKGENNE